MQKFAPIVVRIGLAIVFIWFGVNQVMAPGDWAIMIPGYATKIIPISANYLVLGNGIFEIVFGLLLALGFRIRFVAGLLALHALHIITIVGYNAIGVRDFGIAMATISVFLHGPDAWTLGSRNSSLTPPPPGI